VLETDTETRNFCCPGCRAVAELIESSGLERFYDFRSAPAAKASGRVDPISGWAVCDRPDVKRQLLRPLRDGQAEFRFAVDGVNCAACSWLIDRGLRGLDGINEVSVNPVSREVLVSFDPEQLRISEVLGAVERYGFMPRLQAGASDTADRQAARDELKRLAVAGLGFAQVMMLSAALYLGAFRNMETRFTSFFVLASMLIATPVVLYAGAPIFRAALRDLSHRRIGMDVPVSLAITIALLASLVNGLRGSGHVYFDSATMFVFFLTLGRFLEMRARHRAGDHVAGLAALKPLSALRRTASGLERVGTIELADGDSVVVEPGETVPVDGELCSASALIDESILSGESAGRRRQCGEPLLGGSVNAGSEPLEFRVQLPEQGSYIEQVGGLLQRAMADRPETLQLADRWASVFVIAVLVLTAMTGVFWLYVAPTRALEVVLAMLVVTCPCALSLAAPTAYAVALGRLARLGLLARSTRVLERLGAVTLWLFDKTGTVTDGHLGVVRVEPLAAMPREQCLAIAAALEAGIQHPVARALRQVAHAGPATDVEYTAGFGVRGTIDGQRYRLGSARFVDLVPAQAESSAVFLADDREVLARILLADRMRPNARAALGTLAAGSTLMLVSGDSPGPVTETAQALGLAHHAALQSPADKLELLRARQAGGDVVAAVGDGINDAPLLAQADVSIAMVAGSQLTQASADIVFTGSDLRTLARLPALARASRTVVRQNLIWAACYNLLALPLAAAGLLQPWMAAIGMSLSSLVVVGNALRLNRLLAPAPEPATVDFAALPADGPVRS